MKLFKKTIVLSLTLFAIQPAQASIFSYIINLFKNSENNEIIYDTSFIYNAAKQGKTKDEIMNMIEDKIKSSIYDDNIREGKKFYVFISFSLLALLFQKIVKSKNLWYFSRYKGIAAISSFIMVFGLCGKFLYDAFRLKNKNYYSISILLFMMGLNFYCNYKELTPEIPRPDESTNPDNN